MSREEIDIMDMDNEEFEIQPRPPKRKKKKNKKKRMKKIIIAIEGFVIVVMVFALVLLLVPNVKQKLLDSWLGRSIIKLVLSEDDFNNIHDSDFNSDDIETNEGLVLQDKYTNIVLFGSDSRDVDISQAGHSDSIIIVSIDKDSGVVKLASIYRDTYVKVFKKDGSTSYGRINGAYYNNGAKGSIQTINSNFDLNIKDYAVVNFSGLATIIDKLGGIDVTITEDERGYINGYLKETRKVTGMDTPDVKKSGAVHLTGLQATAYCRIRYVTFYAEDGTKINDDFGRAARQRLVITKIVQLAKNAGVSEMLDLAAEIFKSTSEEKVLTTSLSYDEVMDLIPILINFSLGDQAGYPIYKAGTKINRADVVVPATLSANVSELHNFLFGEENYVPTSTVKAISKEIEEKSGIHDLSKK